MSIVIIQKEGASEWKSCQGITSNLAKGYEIMPDESVYFERVNPSITVFEAHALVLRLIKIKPTAISFIDHYPHPAPIIKALRSYYQKNSLELPLLVFHIFGDYVLQCLQWREMEEDLKEFKTQFICASHNQAALIDSFHQEDECDVIPFPVSDLDYFYSEEVREKAREKYNFKKEFIFLYTGRLSYQKNITTLLSNFSTFIKNFDQKAKLVVAGPMDDLAIPYLGKEALPGTFYFHWEEAIKEYELQEHILYLGDCNQVQLFEVYNAADCYISLSTHNDEDYGMSPAEALCTGLPCILTAWGGFSSFGHYLPSWVDLVDVENRGDRNLPLSHNTFKAMASVFIKKESNSEISSDRTLMATTAHEILGIQAVSSKLKNIFKNCNRKRFGGYTPKFSKLCAQFENNPHSPFRSAQGGYSLFYHDIYKNYSRRAINKEYK
ncbi:MAG: hypothetical protein CME63_15710 [Halobacteriovoraceae bacterium]|nr:hypothetical protein [Halobacteriovoraceae bacterium]|tara:strand:+ start:178169 stop:179482 length:1314 start_codon:yes stop_codon:yes gene_type:complete